MTYYDALVRTRFGHTQRCASALVLTRAHSLRPLQGVSPTASQEDIRRVRAAAAGSGGTLCVDSQSRASDLRRARAGVPQGGYALAPGACASYPRCRGCG